jgi:hypothetical protein
MAEINSNILGFNAKCDLHPMELLIYIKSFIAFHFACDFAYVRVYIGV